MKPNLWLSMVALAIGIIVSGLCWWFIVFRIKFFWQGFICFGLLVVSFFLIAGGTYYAFQ